MIFLDQSQHDYYFLQNEIICLTYILLHTLITKNTFNNNPVEFVSILWGAKNNVESENELTNSGQIKTEQNLKLKLMY